MYVVTRPASVASTTGTAGLISAYNNWGNVPVNNQTRFLRESEFETLCFMFGLRKHPLVGVHVTPYRFERRYKSSLKVAIVSDLSRPVSAVIVSSSFMNMPNDSVCCASELESSMI